MFQGLLKVDDERFFMFEENEIEESEELEIYENGRSRLGRDIQYFYSENDISVEEIVESIVPQRSNKFVIAYYDPEVRNWYTYPRGPFKETLELKKSEIDDFIIPAGHAFVIGAERNFETVNLKHGTEQPRSTLFEIDDLERGWTLLSVKNNTDFQNLIEKCENRVRSIWVQKANNDFEKTEKSYPRLSTGYHLVWFNIGSVSDECFDLSASSGGEYEAPCVSDTPVCDSEGVWYENACKALDSDKSPSSVYLADLSGNCIDYSTVNTGNMPASMCNPLAVSPVCGIDKTYYPNLCLAYAQNPNFVRADIYEANEETENCEFKDLDLSRPQREGFEFDFESNFYKTRTSLESEVSDGRTDFEYIPGETTSGSTVTDSSGVVDFVDNSGSGNSSATVVVDSGVEQFFIEDGLIDPVQIEGDDLIEPVQIGGELIAPVQGCSSDEPVCSVNGLFFKNICELTASGFRQDVEGKYIPEILFSFQGDLLCKPARFEHFTPDYSLEDTSDEPSEPIIETPYPVDPGSFYCENTKCIYNSFLSYPDLNDAIINCEIGHLSCIDSSNEELSSYSVSDPEYFYIIDKILSEKEGCCNR
jgi:hypothetical protein